MKYSELPWLQCSKCQDTAQLIYGDRCANCGPDMSNCSHDMWDTDSNWDNATGTLIVILTCCLCGATTSINVGDLSNCKWELPK